ncbi:MAG: MBL fold metallo-hydrolase [Chloroflexi bacterium]|nr:MBL fold metallo-hydrolase [Chloroflexota bacterium]
MRLTFHGAARTVTGSMHLLETNQHRVMLDCGLFQGHRAEAAQRNANPPVDPKTIDTAILSHAHIDHCGNLPTYIKRGFAGDVNCTSATRDLAMLMLRDSARIQEQDAQYLNQKTSRAGMPPVEPLYTSADAERALQHLVGRPYGRAFNLNGGTRVQFIEAGHILGSAITVMDLTEENRAVRLCFTGDLGRKGTPILLDPELAQQIDYLIIESTYGDREHGAFEKTEDDLARIIRETVTRGGKVVIPAFAVERTQEILYSLHLKSEAHLVPSIPMFVDSPLAVRATDVFRMHLECLKPAVTEHLLTHADPFGFEKLHLTRTVEESKQINQIEGSVVIISANGMCEAGRVLHHLKNTIEDERNTVLFVGYQAENTLGRRIQDGTKKVKIFGDEFSVRAHVESASGFSAHADRSDLIDWVTACKENLKGVFVVHGEEKSALSLADALRAVGKFSVNVPAPGQIFEL